MIDNTILSIGLFGTVWIVTVWKIVGYAGVAMFGGRWVVQIVASTKKRAVTILRLFWYMSLMGSVPPPRRSRRRIFLNLRSRLRLRSTRVRHLSIFSIVLARADEMVWN